MIPVGLALVSTLKRAGLSLLTRSLILSVVGSEAILGSMSYPSA